jgi:hypothetical protein
MKRILSHKGISPESSKELETSTICFCSTLEVRLESWIDSSIAPQVRSYQVLPVDRIEECARPDVLGNLTRLKQWSCEEMQEPVANK